MNNSLPLVILAYASMIKSNHFNPLPMFPKTDSRSPKGPPPTTQWSFLSWGIVQMMPAGQITKAFRRLATVSDFKGLIVSQPA